MKIEFSIPVRDCGVKLAKAKLGRSQDQGWNKGVREFVSHVPMTEICFSHDGYFGNGVLRLDLVRTGLSGFGILRITVK